MAISLWTDFGLIIISSKLMDSYRIESLVFLSSQCSEKKEITESSEKRRFDAT